MSKKQNQRQNEGRELRDDPRVGTRVICRSLLSHLTLLGIIRSIVRYANSLEYWNVLTDGSMVEEGPASGFILYHYNGPEFQTSDRVKYRLDGSGYWEAIVLRPQWSIDHLRFIIRVDRDEHATVKIERGHEFAAHPGRLAKI